MSGSVIEGVLVHDLPKHVDERGYLLEILRSDHPDFQGFGQVYASACLPGMVKAWHAHRNQTDYFCCIAGNVKIGLYDKRPDSPTCMLSETIVCGEMAPKLVIVPPLVWHGFMALGTETAVVLNMPNQLYNYASPDELRASLSEFNYKWNNPGW